MIRSITMKINICLHLSLALSTLVLPILADYPPPSALGHGFYGYHQNQGNSEWGATYPGPHGASPLSKCIDIPANLSLCRGVGYEQMRIPNLLEHDTLREVTEQASAWVHLLGVRCHQDTQMFLCSMFAPVCLERPVYPCRSLCEAVRGGCVDKMLKYGYPWPEMFQCDQFPTDDQLCIGLRPDPHENTGHEEYCKACSHPETYESIINNFCAAQFVMKVKIDQIIVSGSDLKIMTAKKKKIYKRDLSIKTKELRLQADLFIVGGTNCDCPSTDVINKPRPQGQQPRPQSQHYLVMGSKLEGRLVVTFITQFDGKAQGISRALRAIKKASVVKGQPAGIPKGQQQPEGTKNQPGKQAQDPSASFRNLCASSLGKEDPQLTRVSGGGGNSFGGGTVSSGGRVNPPVEWGNQPGNLGGKTVKGKDGKDRKNGMMDMNKKGNKHQKPKN